MQAKKVTRGQVANKLIQDYVPYTDEWGGVDSIAFQLGRAFVVSEDKYLEIGDALPLANSNLFYSISLSTKHDVKRI